MGVPYGLGDIGPERCLPVPPHISSHLKPTQFFLPSDQYVLTEPGTLSHRNVLQSHVTRLILFSCLYSDFTSEDESGSLGFRSLLDAWGWCTGMTRRDGMGREVGGGFRMGTRVHPWQMHVDVWQNQYNIVK